MDKVDALMSLRPGAEWVLRGDELEWVDSNQTEPTEAEIQAEIVRLQADYDSKQYQRDRQPEYPDLADLADALYWSNQAITPNLTSTTQLLVLSKLSIPNRRFPNDN